MTCPRCGYCSHCGRSAHIGWYGGYPYHGYSGGMGGNYQTSGYTQNPQASNIAQQSVQDDGRQCQHHEAA